MATSFRPAVPADLAGLDPDRVLSWVIERAGRAIGYLVLSHLDSAEGARRAYVTGLYVEPDERGKGIGARALGFAAEIGRSLGLEIYSTGVAGEDKRPALSRRAG